VEPGLSGLELVAGLELVLELAELAKLGVETVDSVDSVVSLSSQHRGNTSWKRSSMEQIVDFLTD
jgi:hypothetical protein